MVETRRHIFRRIRSSAAEDGGGGTFTYEFNIGAVDIAPNFLYKIENFHFASGTFSVTGTEGVPGIVFYYMTSDWAGPIINSFGGPISYSYNGIVGNTDLSIAASDIGALNGSTGNNALLLQYGTIINVYGFPFIVQYQAPLFGNLDFGSPFQNPVRDFTIAPGQFSKLYFSVLVDLYQTVAGDACSLYGSLNFDLVQITPEGSR